MRYLTLAAAVVSVGAASAQAQPQLTFTSDSDITMLNGGDTFDVSIGVDFTSPQVGGEEVDTAQFSLQVNDVSPPSEPISADASPPSVLSLAGITANGNADLIPILIGGNLGVDLGVNENTFLTPDDEAPFVLDFGGGIFLGTPLTGGRFEVGTYTFEVAANAAAGDYELAVSDDGNGFIRGLFTREDATSPIPFDSGVLGFTVVPEPATAVLFAMPALAMLRRRRGA